jgi:hypothetical protein
MDGRGTHNMIINKKLRTPGPSGYSGIGASGYSGYSGIIVMRDVGVISFTEVTSETIVASFFDLTQALMDSEIMKPPIQLPGGGGGGIPFP